MLFTRGSVFNRKVGISLLVFAFLSLASAQERGAVLMNSVRNDGGWSLPSHAKRPLPGAVMPSVGKPEVKEISFPIKGSFRIPNDYLQGSELVLAMMEVNATSLDQLSCGKNIFGYYALASTHVGMDFRVWWIDTDGSGKFTMFVRSNDFPGIPKWASEAADGIAHRK